MPENDGVTDGFDGTENRGPADGAYASFETGDGELVVYERRNHTAFVASDLWLQARQ